MYVRCPVDLENEDDARTFLTGQIMSINQQLEKAEVEFHDLHQIRTYYDFVPRKKEFALEKIVHVKLMDGYVKIRGEDTWQCKIIAPAEIGSDGFYHYWVEVTHQGIKSYKKISEYYITGMFTRGDVNPWEQMNSYELQNPYWYQRRQIVIDSLHMLHNATCGFETLIGSRVFLMPHQVDTVIRSLMDQECRFMLADEVGLGKTIEACLIMKGLQERHDKLKTLLISPSSLVNQWKNELSYKFWDDVPIWPDSMRESKTVIFPLENINDENMDFLQQNWDLIIVDETHRLLQMAQTYEIIKKLSSKSPNLLLLTATPIQQRRSEYYQLLSLLSPNRYSKMNVNEFEILLQKQEQLRPLISRMVRDLPHYQEDDELRVEYTEYLSDLASFINDEVFNNIITSVDLHSEDYGLEQVTLAIVYVSTHYEVENRILRHRREELRDSMANRSLHEFGYKMVGASIGFWERDCYEAINDYLKEMQKNCKLEAVFTNVVKILFQTLFSSPWALEELMISRKNVLKGIKTLISVEHGQHWQAFNEFMMMNSWLDEISALDNLLALCSHWRKSAELELIHIRELCDDPDLIKGRIPQVVSYLSDTLEKEKYVVFSGFKATVIPLSKVLKTYFGDAAVSIFHHGMTADELQKSVDRFQNEVTCRFMICDELGGEGRNFQMAEAILHVDLPWNPVQLEQRIGRLDRIGRTREVLNVVFYSQGTVEEDLFKLWRDGLNIFSESLSGLEIALQEINQSISRAFCEDLSYGLGNTLSEIGDQLLKMRDVVDEERYYDLGKQLDSRTEDQLNELIQRFDKNNGEELRKTMLSWADSAGLHATNSFEKEVTIFQPRGFSLNAMKNTIMVPPDMSKIWFKAKNSQQIKGTFSRAQAVKQESLVFFAPGDPFFNAISENARECYKGKTCGMAIKTEFPWSWRGFVYTWTVEINPRFLYERGAASQNLAMGRGFLPLNPIITV